MEQRVSEISSQEHEDCEFVSIDFQVSHVYCNIFHGYSFTVMLF